MKRYYGGVLDRQTENKRQFYQGKDELMNIKTGKTEMVSKGECDNI